MAEGLKINQDPTECSNPRQSPTFWCHARLLPYWDEDYYEPADSASDRGIRTCGTDSASANTPAGGGIEIVSEEVIGVACVLERGRRLIAGTATTFRGLKTLQGLKGRFVDSSSRSSRWWCSGSDRGGASEVTNAIEEGARKARSEGGVVEIKKL